MLSRATAEFFPKYANGHPLLIKNIPGGAAVPAIMEFTKAKPDGYTILHWNTAQVIRTHMGKVGFEATSFAPIIKQTKDHNYLLVRADSPYKNLNEFLADARRKPLSIANASIGGGHHLAALLLQDFTVPFLHVPYGGGGPAVTGLLARHVDASMNIAPEGLTNVAAGQLRILALFAEERTDLVPGAPTAREQGVNLLLPQWRGIVAPNETPTEIQARLHDIFARIMRDPEFKQRLRGLGFGHSYLNPEEFGKLIREEDAKFKRVIIENKLGDRYF
ncbi:MAG: tripartite tricarboxylate transporter substrate binding protein [Syntrophomonadaceae bacterium]|nr:tripartite tricarboxylate transporter substrate binding protein [Syntrophomonadaceae bacterium]